MNKPDKASLIIAFSGAYRRSKEEGKPQDKLFLSSRCGKILAYRGQEMMYMTSWYQTLGSAGACSPVGCDYTGVPV